MDQMELPLDTICLSNDVPVATYSNFLYDVPYVIFVFDCTVLSVEYISRVDNIFGELFQEHHLCDKLLILLNKTDVVSVSNVNSLERCLKLETLGVEYLIMPTCGNTGYGVSEGINWLLT